MPSYDYIKRAIAVVIEKFWLRCKQKIFDVVGVE